MNNIPFSETGINRCHESLQNHYIPDRRRRQGPEETAPHPGLFTETKNLKKEGNTPINNTKNYKFFFLHHFSNLISQNSL
jgi:hypothetical protein